MIFRSKKGVSPIIAAVLLVVITIAIGATTMAFIRSLSDQNLQTATQKAAVISCGSDVSLDVLSVGDSNKECKGSNYFWVTLRNKGTKNIKYFRLTTIGTGTPGFNTSIGTVGISTNGIKVINISFDSTTQVTNPDEFQLEPVIQGAGTDVYCADSLLKWSAANLADCPV